ncbi:Rhs family protein [gamma proteobacterium HdN1]|nr:Rhs family protein [gamma proteobacterium HdN1]
MTRCKAQIGPSSLSYCTEPHMQNWCEKHCAAAVDNSCEAKSGNPINLSNGAKEHTETDFQGRGSFPLNITRSYSSSAIAPDSGFGKKWSGVGNPHVVSRGATYTYIDENGVRTVFNFDAASPLKPRPAKADTAIRLYLQPNMNWGGSKDGWLVEFPDRSARLFEFDIQQFDADLRYTSRLLSESDTQGGYQDYRYDSEKRVSRVRNHVGDELHFTYYADGSNHIQSITAPGNQTFRYEYDAQGNLAKVFYPDETPNNDTDNPFKQYHYEDSRFPNHLTGITDENGERFATYAYNEAGRAILSTHAAGAGRIDVEYVGDQVHVQNAAGQETIYEFMRSGSAAKIAYRLSRIQGQPTGNCGASNSTIHYNSAGFRDYVVDGRGYATHYTYDSQGREIRRREAMRLTNGALTPTAETRTTETDWAQFGDNTLGYAMLVSERRVPGKTSRYTYEHGRVASVTEIDTTTQSVPYSTAGQTRVWSYTYTYHDDAERLPATVRLESPSGAVSVQHFNAQGFLTRVERRSGDITFSTQVSEHDASGRPTKIMDENGVETRLTYTPRGWLASRTLVMPEGNAVAQYRYDNVGQITEIRLPDHRVLNYEYDAAQRKVAVIHQGERIEYELDPFGNVTAERTRTANGALRYVQQKAFDDLGRLWKVLGLDGQATLINQYDENDNVIAITDAYQRPLTQSFDGLNRLTHVTDREAGVVEYTYNAQGQLASVTDQKGLVTTYVVDGFGRKIQQKSPDTGTTTYYYDLSDHLTKTVDARGVVTEHRYDGFNRLTSVHYPSSAQDDVTYQYDATITASQTHFGRGRLTRISEANGNSIDWIYNAQGQIIRELRTQSGKTYATAYQYDLAANLIQITYPSGRELSYGYDNKGRIHQIRSRENSSKSWTTLANNLSYEPFGPLTGFTWGNGLTETLSYDAHYQPASIQTTSGSTDVRSLQYGFNLANELDHLTDAKTPARSQLFSYDPNGRLNQAQGQYGTLVYQYDLTGNRVSQAQTNASDGKNFTESYQYPATSHRLTQISASGLGGQNRNFQYSAAGNLTQDERYTYVYNDVNRLTKIFSGPAIVAEYRYNHLGERISKTADGKTTQFIYGPNHQLLAEHHQDGTPIRDYVYLGDKLLAMVDADTTTNPDTGTKADLAITLKGATGNSVKQPDGRYQVTYKVNVQNAGGSAAENVLLTNTFPATDVNLVSYTTSQGTCADDASSCDLGTINVGQTVTVTLIASKGQKAKENFSASVTTSSEESNTDNNSATAAFGGAFGLWIMAFLTAMLGLRTRFAKHALNRKNTISTACLLLCGLSLMGANTSQAEQIYYVHTDHLNTPTLVTDSNKTVVWEGVRKPFGETEEVVNTVRQPIRFPGQYFDGETGLSYNLMRDYDARVGRYVQSDPIGLMGGVSTYGYGLGNPMLYVDPLGLETCLLITRTSWGFGTHSALWASNGMYGQQWMYDPSGSYNKEHGGGTGDLIEGASANIKDFADFHKGKDGDSTEVICKNTTVEHEKRLQEIAEGWGGGSGLVCASYISAILMQSGVFSGITGSRFPGGLANQFGEAMIQSLPTPVR